MCEDSKEKSSAETAGSRKRLGILTFHYVNNFGGALQAYALWKTLNEKCGVDARLVDYRSRFICFADFVRLFPITTNAGELVSGLRTMPERLGRLRRFRRFVKEHMTLTRRFGTPAALRKNPPEADGFLCGSDQVWNPVITLGVSPVYFLGFTDKKKFSYAPSFGTGSGQTSLKPAQERKMKKYLARFDRISVRETEGEAIVKRLTGRDPVQLIDPVFLPGRREWLAAAARPKRRGDYILLYMMQHDDSIYGHVRAMKERLGLPVIAISRYGYRPEGVDTCLVNVGPREFVGLFACAAAVCTNSFHGLAFSLIFDKPCELIGSKNFGSRMENLLRLLEIGRDPENGQLVFDKDELDRRIDREREKALAYLRECVDLLEET